MKSFLSLCVLIVLALSQVNANCSGNCPDTEEVVWALGGGVCNVFRNKCYFDKENCYRKPALSISTMKECQKKCPEICPQIFSPVTGTYGGETKTFGNQCMMIVHTCKTGETFLNVA